MYQNDTLLKLALLLIAIALANPIGRQTTMTGRTLFHRSPVLKDNDSLALTVRADILPQLIGGLVAESVKAYPRLNSETLTKAIISEAQTAGVDPILVAAIIQQESRFNSRAIGSHGEIGLMQILPSTAGWIAQRTGLELEPEVDLYDPMINIRVGVRYLAWLNSQFTDIRHTITAYNMGPGNVRRVLKKGLKPDIYYAQVLVHYKDIYSYLRPSVPYQNETPGVSPGRLFSFNF